ncbi:MAG: CAP domain-containing protein [Lachnospiraceae bacterium]|nr:CAP domain-containing protein [Lachnospiraceae bacterium]
MKKISRTVCMTLATVMALCFTDISTVSSLCETTKKASTESKTPGKEDVQAQLALDTFNAINAYRKSLGLPELVWNDTLSTIAFKRAKETARKFSHIRPNGRSYETLFSASGLAVGTVGESIGTGYYTGIDILGIWLASDFHRQMIEDGTFNYIAVGTYINDKGVSYIAAEFMQ